MDPGFYKHNRKKNPRADANYFSIFTFWWLRELFSKGYNNQLKIDDVYVPLEDLTGEVLGNQCEELWNKELKKEKPSFFNVLFKLHGVYLITLSIIYSIFEIIFRVAQPICLGFLISYFSPGQTSIDESEAYLYATGLILSMLFHVFLLHPFLIETYYISTKIRIACSSVIYRKVLRMNLKSQEEDNLNGRILNLLSNDVNRFEYCCMFFMEIWRAPIEAIIVICIMYINIGPAGLIGIAFVLALIPVQAWLGKVSASIQRKATFITDDRIKLMNEVIQGIQIIKMYAWEKYFKKTIGKIRKNEMNFIRKITWIKAILFCFVKLNTRISIFISILAYVLFGNQMNASKIFVLYSLYDLIKISIVDFFPLAIMSIMEAKVSVGRIQEFLLLPELNFRKSNNINTNEKNDSIISIKNLCVSWNKSNKNTKTESVALENITLNISEGELTSVIGQVGSGKTILFNTILGEIELKSGSLDINGALSYCSQSSWLFEASVQQNILFGQEMNHQRYKDVIKCCQLETDLKSFPHGDQTIVGERGVSLSGGQKARISLARCIYRQANLYLLDDPLSAVDTKVGHRLMNMCIKGFLKDKSVILITNQFEHLRSSDNICIMDGGKFVFQGTYDEFKQSTFNTNSIENLENDAENLEDKVEKNDLINLNEHEHQDKEEEEQKSGSVEFNVYKEYAKSGYNPIVLIIIFAIFILSQISYSFSDWWISIWVNSEEVQNSSIKLKKIYKSLISDLNSDEFLYIYTGLIVISIIFTLAKHVMFFNMCIKASINLHNSMFGGIIRASMWFFHTNSSGRIVNRFSRDIGIIDISLPTAFADCISFFLETLGIIIIVCIINYWLLIPTIIILIILLIIRRIYISTARSLKRLEGICRSPALTHVNATIDGLETIRASNMQFAVTKEFDKHLNLHTSVWILVMNTSRAFSFWMDIVCCIYLALITYSFLILTNEDIGGKVGLAITQVMGLIGMCQWGLRQTAEVENQMTSVERIVEYVKLPSEASLETDEKLFKKKYPNTDLSTWPSNGDLEFKNVFLTYDKNNKNNYILQDINFKVESGEKIGIVGRTGAGKSSIISALFRLTESDGTIKLSGVEINTLGLYLLRSSMTIIPQEPMLFSGTLRKNLDPWNLYTDDQLWQALEQVELKVIVSNYNKGLDMIVADGGVNFSVGQRQLLCLTRAILKKSNFILLDEATANVDPDTDKLIQRTIKKTFSNKTILTIAHRLNTIIDSDKILVMDEGKVVEFDHPYVLLNKNIQNVNDESKNIFKSLLKQTGQLSYDALQEIAKKSYDENQLKKQN